MHTNLTRSLGTHLSMAAALVAVLLLGACGGGSTTAPASSAKGMTAVYFTDDFASTFDAVWLSVTRVTVVSPTVEVELVSYSPAKLVNVPTLRRAGALVATASIPADATAVRVYVGSRAKLQQFDGSLLEVSLTAPTGYLEFTLEGWKASSGALALDFDLPRFKLQGNTLVPSTRVANANDYAGWNQRHAEVKGTVAQVTSTSLVLDTKAMGQRTFALDSNTTYVSGRSATWRPAVGDRVEVKSAVAGQGASGLQFTARVVTDAGAAAAGGLVKIEAVVTSVSGNLVTATVNQSENQLALGVLTFDMSGAVFKRGNAASVQPGVRVEAYLTNTASVWVAKIIEIEGAGKSGTGEDKGQSFAEVKGQVVSVTGSSVVVKALQSERFPGLLSGTEITVDLATAMFDVGALSCVAAGLPIEIKGSLDATAAFTVVEVSVGGACAAAYPATDLEQLGHQDAPVPTSGSVDIEGSILAVRPGEFDIKVFDLEQVAMTATQLTVRYSSATVFRGTTALALATGAAVEIKGDLQNGVITATKVERR